MRNHHRLLAMAAFGVLFGGELRAFQRPAAACDQFEAAVRADPRNVDAAASLGQCSVRDYTMIAPGGDSSRMVFRSSWSTALRALRHAVEVDPGNSRAYRPLFRILFAETRDGCSFVTGECMFVSPVVRDGDSMLTIPRRVRLNVPGTNTYEDVVRESQATRQANLSEARTLAARWATVAPDDRRPREYLGRALSGLGDYSGATAELEQAARLGTPASRRELFWDRLEALVKSDRGADARRVLDEAASDPGADTSLSWRYAMPGLDALLGRHRPPPQDTSARARAREVAMLARFDSIRRTRPPAPPPSPGFVALLASGDSTGARREMARLDSFLEPAAVRGSSGAGGMILTSAEQHLALGDTAGAEARLTEIERTFRARQFRHSVGMWSGPRPWSGRAWLLAGDVSAARGRREEATRMYRRVIGLWSGGDAELQPVVDRARARLERLAPR